jgi:APA family basic amino acid/polyamine antiporter
MEPPANSPAPGFRAHLSLWDAVSIIAGIVIGASIYEIPPSVFQNAASPWMGLAVWVIAGLLCLIGALCYAELASTYPRLGGDYFYLTRAYGSEAGFLYGWAQLGIIQTANIGMMAYVFADYAVKLWDLPKEWGVLFALLAVAGLSLMNILGVVVGKGTQNVLTAAKILGLGGILVAGFYWGHVESAVEGPAISPNPSLKFALIPVFFAYGGWNDAAFVAAEMRNPRRNIPLALILATVGIIVIYVLVNGAYLLGLGFEGVQRSDAVAADVLKLARWPWGYQAMCILVMISALGAANGLIFTSSRIYAALGADHVIFSGLSRWHPKLGSPVWSLLTQAASSLVMIAAVGTTIGREGLNELFTKVGLGAVPWEGRSGFGTLLQCSAPIFWFFFLLSALSLFVLRFKDRGMNRPFSVPFFPIIPLIFLATCAYMLYSGIDYAGNLGLVGAALLLVGVPLCLISKLRRSTHVPQPIPAVDLVGTGSLDHSNPGAHEIRNAGPGGESRQGG